MVVISGTINSGLIAFLTPTTVENNNVQHRVLWMLAADVSCGNVHG